jgi:hypothetical protein
MDDSCAHSELLARLRNLIDDTRTLKNQQWQTTYYSLLLSGAMLALTKLDATLLISWHKYVFFGLLLLAAAGQGYLVIRLHVTFGKSLSQYQSHAYSINSLLDRATHLYGEIDSQATIKRDSLRLQHKTSSLFTSIFIALGLAGPVFIFIYSIYKLFDP